MHIVNGNDIKHEAETNGESGLTCLKMFSSIGKDSHPLIPLPSFDMFKTIAEKTMPHISVAYKQYELAIRANLKDADGDTEPGEDVKQAADAVRAGGPANLSIIMTIGKINGLNIKVVDDQTYMKTQEDFHSGFDVIYIVHSHNDGIGHAYYMDSNGQVREAPSKGYDCAFAAISKILEGKQVSKSAGELRAEAAAHMEANPVSFSKALSAENWIRTTYPVSVNKMIFTVGARILLTCRDVMALYYAITSKVLDRDRRLPKFFTKNIHEKNSNPRTRKAAHHIIPRHEINAFILAHDPSDLEPLRKAVESLINHPTTRAVIEERGGIKPENEYHTGKLLHAAIVYHPSNVVSGPLPKDRWSDPKGGIDVEIKRLQKRRHKNGVNEFVNEGDKLMKIVRLSEIPDADPVDWAYSAKKMRT